MTQQATARPYQPSTFLERGVAVPFTTPALAGARARPAERAGLELVVPNPSGGRGIYVVPWTDLRTICTPTVHDVRLTESIAALPCVSPATIRDAARRIASEGLAGRAAGEAAAAALVSTRASLVATSFALLRRLVEQEEPAAPGPPAPEIANPATLQARAKRVVAALAVRLGADPAALATALDEVAGWYEPVGLAPIGLAPDGPPARLPQAVAALARLREEAALLPHGDSRSTAAMIRLLLTTADLTLAAAAAALDAMQLAAGSVALLLAAWRTDPAGLGRQLTRPDWLMDGWDRPCRLWALDPSPQARLALLPEITGLLPIMPREAGEWTVAAAPGATSEPPIYRRMVGRHEDWRTGACVQDTIARNEALVGT